MLLPLRRVYTDHFPKMSLLNAHAFARSINYVPDLELR